MKNSCHEQGLILPMADSDLQKLLQIIGEPINEARALRAFDSGQQFISVIIFFTWSLGTQ